MKNGKFDEAIAAFAALGDYSDSAAQISDAKRQKQEAEQEAANRSAYEAAEKLLTDEDYDAAIEAFTALGGYADASDRAAEAGAAKQAAEEEAANKEAYAAAEKLLEEKKYADAKAAFEALGAYSDAKAKADECQKQIDAQAAAVVKTAPAATNPGSNTKRVDGGDGTYTIYEYNANGAVTKGTQYNTEGKLLSYYINEYDASGQLVTATYYSGDGWWYHIYHYVNGKLYSKDDHRSGIRFFYDENGEIDYSRNGTW